MANLTVNLMYSTVFYCICCLYCFVQTAGKSDLLIKLGVKTDCTIICRWSDRIFMSRHHQPICMGWCGDDLGVSNYVRWWRGFPMRKHEKWRSIISPSKQSRCQVAVHNSHQTNSATEEAGIHSTLMHFHHYGFDVVVCHVASDKDILNI